MASARQSVTAIRSLTHQTTRRLSVSTSKPAISPYKRPSIAQQSGSKNAVENAGREQSTAAAPAGAPQSRPAPSPAFNRDSPKRNQPSPLQPYRPQEMDHTFVGMTGGQIFHEMMLRHQVKHVFGYPGGAILPVFDAIYNSPHFDFILPRHEQGAGHMAEGYARASGKPGVVLVTSGPGATNTITPILHWLFFADRSSRMLSARMLFKRPTSLVSHERVQSGMSWSRTSLKCQGESTRPLKLQQAADLVLYW